MKGRCPVWRIWIVWAFALFVITFQCMHTHILAFFRFSCTLFPERKTNDEVLESVPSYFLEAQGSLVPFSAPQHTISFHGPHPASHSLTVWGQEWSCVQPDILTLFQGQPWGDSWEGGRVGKGLFKCNDAILSRNWKLALISTTLAQTG